VDAPRAPGTGGLRARTGIAVSGLLALLVTACGGDDSGSASGGTTGTSTAAPVELPEAEDISGLPGAIPGQPFPDFALALDGVVWISGIQPGIVGYDGATGEQRAVVETSDVMLAMDAGFGALWAVETSDGRYPDTVLRIDPATGEVTARIPAPEPGVLPESSLAVTDDAVWALTGQIEDPEDRSLAAVDPTGGRVRDVFPAPPGAAAVRGGFGSLWISVEDGSVVRVDPADGSTVATIATGEGSRFLTVTDDAVWVLNNVDGTVSRIDPDRDEVVATVTVSAGSIEGGDIAAGEGTVWARTTRELATEVDAETSEVVRVLGPPAGSGSVAVAGDTVWLTAHDVRTTYRVPLS
jgi:virginiamycin B lyase